MSEPGELIYPDAPKEHLVRDVEGSGGEGWEYLESQIEKLKNEHPDPDSVDFKLQIFDYSISLPGD